jgi:dTDP-4-dehydrorhamnose reductase
MKILITGGSGLLGKQLISILETTDIYYYAPTSQECNIMDLGSVSSTFHEYKPTIVIHCAAVAKYKIVEEQPVKALLTNVVGTCNVVASCNSLNLQKIKGDDDVKLVYISTDHLFDGEKGNYTTDDRINPLSKYAKTKGAGELSVRIYENHLSIRTSFCPKEFPFDTAYVDKWTSQDYVDIIADKILNKVLSNEVGIVNVGSSRRSFYELAKERKPNVNKGSISEAQSTSKVPILVDTSLKVD